MIRDGGMSQEHLHDLENALTRRGWRIVAALPGDGYRISATWEIQRSTRQPSHFIDFAGLDPAGYCLPLERAYGCDVRGRPDVSLYFGKRREHWTNELAAFVAAPDREARP
jgi:hypothetical protein